MIQFIKGYQHGKKKIPIGQKATFDPRIEAELIEKKIAVRTTWNGKTIKMKTDFFNPKKQ